MCRLLVHARRDSLDTSNRRCFLKGLSFMRSGGPDSQNIMSSEKVLVGHNRLSLFDHTRAGDQPMTSSCGHYRLLFNGECYNHEGLRKELKEPDGGWKSGSDTETVLESIVQQGLQNTCQRIRGMFAICLWDIRKDVIMLARDTFGIKPIYWMMDSESFIAGSEVKPIAIASGRKQTISKDGLDDYFRFGYYRGNNTFFSEIYSLAPGEVLRLDLKSWEQHRFPWKKEELQEKEVAQRDLGGELEEKLLESLLLRLKGDVEVPLFLSGGIDSTLLLTVAKKLAGLELQTFTARVADKRYDESIYASYAAERLGCKQHNTVFIDRSDYALHYIESIGRLLDQPFGDSSLVITHLLAKAVRQAGFKCFIGADGADELFGGYKKYRKIYMAQVLEMTPWIKKIQYRQMRYKGAAFITDRYDVIFEDNAFKQSKIVSNTRLVHRPYRFSDLYRHDVKNYLVGDILTKCDRASMHASVENREVFLDSKVASHASVRCWHKRRLLMRDKEELKHILGAYFPADFVNRKKMGFASPLQSWMKCDHLLRYLKREVLSSFALVEIMPISRDYLIDILNKAFRDMNDLTEREFAQLWAVYCWIMFVKDAYSTGLL